MLSSDSDFDPLAKSNENSYAPDIIPQDHSKIFIEWFNKQQLIQNKESKPYACSAEGEPFTIQSDAEFHWALARFNEIIDADENTSEDFELKALETAIDTYWDFLYPKESE
jgi:hypothetical protein